MKMNFRPFLKREVAAAAGATIAIRCFSVTSATASVMGSNRTPGRTT